MPGRCRPRPAGWPRRAWPGRALRRGGPDRRGPIAASLRPGGSLVDGWHDGGGDLVGPAVHQGRREVDGHRVDFPAREQEVEDLSRTWGRWPRPRGRSGCDAPPLRGHSSATRLWSSARELGHLRGHCSRRRRQRARPGRPTLLNTATRSPWPSGWDPTTWATSKSSSMVSTRITPVWRNRAATVSSELASAAVCEEAARRPTALRPAFTATTGLDRLNWRASRANLRGLPNDSRYSRPTPVASSSAHHDKEVVAAHVGLVAHRDEAREPDAPLFRLGQDGDAEAAGLGGKPEARRPSACPWQRWRSSKLSGSVLSTPKQLGPTIRMP